MYVPSTRESNEVFSSSGWDSVLKHTSVLRSEQRVSPEWPQLCWPYLINRKCFQQLLLSWQWKWFPNFRDQNPLFFLLCLLPDSSSPWFQNFVASIPNLFIFLGSKYNFVQLPAAVGISARICSIQLKYVLCFYELCLVVELNSTNYMSIDRQGRQLFTSWFPLGLGKEGIDRVGGQGRHVRETTRLWGTAEEPSSGNVCLKSTAPLWLCCWRGFGFSAWRLLGMEEQWLVFSDTGGRFRGGSWRDTQSPGPKNIDSQHWFPKTLPLFLLLPNLTTFLS